MRVVVTHEAARVMGVWIRRVDAGLARRGVENAHRALAEAQLLRLRRQVEETEAELQVHPAVIDLR